MQQVPGTESWGDKYGAIGVIAAVLLVALAFIGRMILGERAKDRADSQARIDRELATKEAQIAERERAVAELNAKLLQVVQANHTQTLEMLNDQREAHDKRYQELLEAQRDAEADTRALAAATVKAVQSLTEKIK